MDKNEFEIKLIMEVKSHSCLYAKNDPAYSNKIKRSRAWDEVASIVGKTVDECQKKWNTLRDSFRAYLRLENNTPSGSGAVAAVKWIHFNSLKFLIPFVRVSGDDCGKFSESPNNPRECCSEQIEVDVDIEEIMPSQQPRRPRTTKSKKRKIGDEDEPLDRVLCAIENNNRRKPMELFMENIALQVEHFSQRKAVRFQTRILQILAEELEIDD